MVINATVAAVAVNSGGGSADGVEGFTYGGGGCADSGGGFADGSGGIGQSCARSGDYAG